MKKNEVNKTFPERWDRKKFSEVATSIKGKKPETLYKSNKKNRLPYITIKAFETGEFFRYTDDENSRFCDEGDLLIVWDGSRSGLVGKAYKGAIGSTIAKLEIEENIDTDFTFYFLKSKYQTLNTNVKGTGTPHVDPKVLWNFDFPVPPLPEQKRIVARIEELFSTLDNGVANLQKAREQLNAYRQSVLKSAFEGNWKEVTIDEIIDNKRYGTSQKATKKNKGLPVLRMGNIQNGELDFSDLKYLPKNYEENEKYLLEHNDVLFNRTNSAELVGKTAIYKEGRHPKSTFASYLIRLQVDEEQYLPDLLTYYINSPYGREYMANVRTQNVGQANVNGTKLGKMSVPLIPLQEQKQIVREIEHRLSVTDQLAHTIETALQKAESLRQSILKSAFEGRLVEQGEGYQQEVEEVSKAAEQEEKYKIDNLND